MRIWWERFKAYFRIDQRSICEQSDGVRFEFHDYVDGTGWEGEFPMHFYRYTCRHCGKEFYL